MTTDQYDVKGNLSWGTECQGHITRYTYGYDLCGRCTQIKKHLPAQTNPDALARFSTSNILVVAFF